MTQRAEDLYQVALTLTDSERADLATRLLESLDPDTEDDADVETAWASEIADRLGEADRGEVRPIPWDEARRMIADDGH